MCPNAKQNGADGKADDGDFSSTMRIDIPPDLMTEQAQKAASKLDTSKIRIRSPATKRITRISPAEGANKYNQLLQSIYDAAVITDLNGVICDSNIRATEFLGYTRQEMAGMNIIELISGADLSILNTLCQNLQNERFALLQAYCVRKDRSFFPAEIAANLLKFEEMRLCFFVRDVTLRRQAEEMLRTEHNAIQNSGNGIAIANEDGKLEYVNPAILRTWNYENGDELVGQDARVLLAENDATDQMFHVVLEEHQSWTGELTARTKDGGTLELQVSAACNRDSDGEVVGMVVSFVDISDRKRAEEALRQSERQRVMLASVGAACHHLGQPATVIMANLELIKRLTKDVDKAELKEILKLTCDAADTLAEVLHKLNTVNEYRTVQYLDASNATSPENVILDI